MAKYSWDIESLLERKKYIEEQIRKYNNLLNLYDDLIECYSIKKYYEINPSKEIIIPKKVISIKDAKCIFDSIPSERIELIKDAINVSKNYDYSFETPTHTKLKLSDKELVEITRSFFKKLPNKFFLDKFDEFTNPENHLLHIRHYKTLPLDETLGLTYVDTESHTSYGTVARHGSVCDIITLAHEIFHMILRQKEEPFFSDTNKTVYSEVEGCFADLLFSSYLRDENYNKEILDRFDRFDLTRNLDNIETFFTLYSGFNLMDSNGKIDFRKLRPILRKHGYNTPINKSNFTMLIDYSSFSDVNDTVSYLTALDLFNGYEKDPEKSIYKLLLIPQLSGDNPKKDLESIGVSFFEDGYTNLDGQCKKLLKTKTTS